MEMEEIDGVEEKVAAKRQVWNKGLEIGKRDGFTPAQVKRIRGFSEIVVSPGSEIWLCSLRRLILCCTDITCSLSLSETCRVAMVQSVPLLRLLERAECHRCVAPCRKYHNGA